MIEVGNLVVRMYIYDAPNFMNKKLLVVGIVKRYDDYYTMHYVTPTGFVLKEIVHVDKDGDFMSEHGFAYFRKVM